MAKYCAACGNGLIATSVICPKCGSPTGPVIARATRTKTKAVAVWIAVLCSFWSWLYTAQRNASKFFSGLLVGLAGAILAVIGQLNVMRLDSELEDCFTRVILNGGDFNFCFELSSSLNYAPNQAMVWVGLTSVVGIWVWAIVDNARRPPEFFEKYGS